MTRTHVLSAVATALTVSACGGGGGGGGDGSSLGGSAVFLKDAPIVTSDARPADEVNLEILKVELKKEEGRDGEDVTVFEAAPGSGISVNLLALNFPMLLSVAQVPEGRYDEIELKVNPGNATIHFTDDDSTLPLVVTESGEGDETAEFEFEFEPPFTVEAGTVSNAVVDFAPIVTFDGANYVLDHDHDDDDTGEVEHVDGDDDDGPDHHGAEVEGLYQSIDGDRIVVSRYGASVQIDISAATLFEVDGEATDKAGFIASLSPNDEIEGEGVFADGVLLADKVENDGVDD
jgi:hypothetical protein